MYWYICSVFFTATSFKTQVKDMHYNDYMYVCVTIVGVRQQHAETFSYLLQCDGQTPV